MVISFLMKASEKVDLPAHLVGMDQCSYLNHI